MNESEKKIIDKSEIDKSDSIVLNFEQFMKKIHSEFVWYKMIKSNILKDNNIRFMTDISISEDTCLFFLEQRDSKLFPENFIFIELDPDLLLKHITSLNIKTGK